MNWKNAKNIEIKNGKVRAQTNKQQKVGAKITATAAPKVIPEDMDRKYLAETVSRRDAAAEPPWRGSRRVSARCLRFMSVVNNGFMRIHCYRDIQAMSLIFVGQH